MNGNEFLDKMELIDSAYVAAADIKSTKRKNIWRKWGTVAASACLIVVSALAVYGVSNPNNEPEPMPVPMPNINGTIQREEMPKDFPEPTILRPGDEGYIEPQPTLLPEPTIGPEGGVIQGPINYIPEPGEVIPMISGYGESTYQGDMSVADGGFCFSAALQSALEYYGETANYRVLVELFSDGVQISSGGELAQKECQRLSNQGYMVAMETFTQTKSHGEYITTEVSYYFTLHATYAQLKNFRPSDKLGYSLCLYGEYFGDTVLSEPVVFNAAAADDN